MTDQPACAGPNDELRSGGSVVLCAETPASVAAGVPGGGAFSLVNTANTSTTRCVQPAEFQKLMRCPAIEPMTWLATV